MKFDETVAGARAIKFDSDLLSLLFPIGHKEKQNKKSTRVRFLLLFIHLM